MTDKPKDAVIIEPTTMDHFCPPADVQTMARRLNLDKRRVQQLAKEWLGAKSDRGEYICPVMVIRYTQMQQAPKRSKASGLTKKQEESLDIRNARDRGIALSEWNVMVLQRAVIEELAPMIVSLKNGLREIPSVQARQVLLLVKETVDQALSGSDQPSDFDILSRAQKIMAGPQDEKLASFEKDLRAWMEEKNNEATPAGDAPQKNAEGAEL